MSPLIAIVDGYSTGRYLAPQIHRFGGSTVHVPSSPEPPKILERTRDAHGANKSLPYAAADSMAAHLRELGVERVIAGAESGVLFADELCRRLGIDWNTTESSRARRDKYEMIEQLRRCGLRVVGQVRSADAEEIHRWAQAQRQWPIVIKPVMSTSSEDVFFCRDIAQIREATDTIVGKRNFLDVLNVDVLAQTYLDGPIYVVNSVSHGGTHTTSDVWQFDFERTPGKGIRMLQHTLLSRSFEKFDELVAYNNAALTALGIHNGPSHTELKLTEHGPSMIETGARLMGATIEDEPFKRSLPYTQVELTAMALCAPEEFAKLSGSVQQPRTGLAIVWVHFDTEGRITGDAGLSQLAGISSLAGCYGLPAIGDQVGRSQDTTGRGGFIYLQSDNELDLHRDSRRVCRLVREQSLFDLDTRKAN
ncbi:ATP-grasp domain-containing protein [Nocardia huaxiensis]|uniref:ATP-grasp domain-containing protein n=1 Tax=Nocardia huaxiensis TaxID=2755382 RepID=A0A7D6ZHH0_9NOCA|nr:ATP-grasp domain-containing protein [Nocardia huaxiensis]QLY28083.1 ATP-grasp domain-containing protein [Nocardia huaxiensis]